MISDIKGESGYKGLVVTGKAPPVALWLLKKEQQQKRNGCALMPAIWRVINNLVIAMFRNTISPLDATILRNILLCLNCIVTCALPGFKWFIITLTSFLLFLHQSDGIYQKPTTPKRRASTQVAVTAVTNDKWKMKKWQETIDTGLTASDAKSGCNQDSCSPGGS